MARTKENAKLNSRDARIKAKLKPRSEPYWHALEKGLAVGYFKGSTGGTWVARHFTVESGRRKQSLGVADDHTDANGLDVLSFDQAQRKAREWRDQLISADRGEVAEGKYTVADALDHYITEKEREKRKPQERTRQIADAHIKPELGHISLHKLTHGKVKAWRDSLAAQAPRIRTKAVTEKRMVSTMLHGEKVERMKERATDKLMAQAYKDVDMDDPEVMRQRQASANRILTVLKAALNFAHQERKISSKSGWEAVKPFRKVDVPKVRFLAADEVAGLIRECEASFAKLVKGALLTGCRYGELTALDVAEYKRERGVVHIAESKNGESRDVELNAEGIAFFDSLTTGRDAKEPIFLKANGKPWMKSEQKRPIDAACEAAEIQGVTFHILRHTYASHAVMNGMPIAVLSEQLGHKDTRITERHYAHLSKTYKQKLIRDNAPSFGFAPVAPSGPQLVARAS